MSGGGSKPGERRGGRQKGTPNKLNADVKAMILTALNEVGGAKYLGEQARTNPNAFLTLVGKVLPMQVNATLKHELREMTDDELLAIISRAGIAESAAGEDERPAVH